MAETRAPFVKKIGVCFCGATIIGKDLKAKCKKYSNLEQDLLFKLHKENF